jgi:hypothetical protein
MFPKLKNAEQAPHPKTRLWASDAEKLEADIVLALQGVEPSNPIEWSDTLKWSAGKGVELRMVEILKANGIVADDFCQNDTESYAIERYGCPISMNFDAKVRPEGAKIETSDLLLPQGGTMELLADAPIEIKTINNKNAFDIASYKDNKPRSNYVLQLSIYLDALNKSEGYLFASTIDGLNTFWYRCFKREDGKYQCGDTIVDVDAEYKRFAGIWQKFLALEIVKMNPGLKVIADLNKWEMPEINWNEESYKLPIKDIDWTKLSTTKIGDMRNNRSVLGSENGWKIQYSPYKDIIVAKQGATLGYTDQELAEINQLTAGYTSKAKKVETKVEEVAEKKD